MMDQIRKQDLRSGEYADRANGHKRAPTKGQPMAMIWRNFEFVMHVPAAIVMTPLWAIQHDEISWWTPGFDMLTATAWGLD